MSTTIRSEVSKKNEYYVEKHRYYELKHFCLQYPIWKKARVSLDGLSKRPDDLGLFKSNGSVSPTERCAIARLFYAERINMIEHTAFEAADDLARYIIKGVTEGVSYMDSFRSDYKIGKASLQISRLVMVIFSWIISALLTSKCN